MDDKKTVVIDLDGTLANIMHRTHLVKSRTPNWEQFYSLVSRDGLNRWCRFLMTALSTYGSDVVIVSARPEKTRENTEAWLKGFGICYNQLYLLRGDKDFTPDHELKKKWLEKYGKNKILFVVDDRTSVVDMWRSEGIVCLQAYRWEEFKKEEKINGEKSKISSILEVER